MKTKFQKTNLNKLKVLKGKRATKCVVNDLVSIRDLRDPTPNAIKWMPAIVDSVLGSETYVCRDTEGNLFRRYLDQMQSRSESSESNNQKTHKATDKHTHYAHGSRDQSNTTLVLNLSPNTHFENDKTDFCVQNQTESNIHNESVHMDERTNVYFNKTSDTHP